MNPLLTRLLEAPDIQFTIDNVAVRKFPAAFTFGPHAHRFIELDYIEEGGCGMLFGTELVRLGAGDCLLIYPDASHYFFTRARAGCTIVQLEFAVENFPWPALPGQSGANLAFLDEVRTHSQPFRKLHPGTGVSQCIRDIRQESAGTWRGKEEMLRLLFARLFILLSREVEGVYDVQSGLQAGEGTLARQAAAILANEFGESLDFEELALRLGVSSRYLRRCFHEAWGMGIGEWLLGLRLRKASALLARPGLSVLEVALQCGFASSQYFARVFRKELGLAPLEFRALVARQGMDSLP